MPRNGPVVMITSLPGAKTGSIWRSPVSPTALSRTSIREDATTAGTPPNETMLVTPETEAIRRP